MALRCDGCGGPLVSALQGGSYLLRCPACGRNYNCTSWMAVAPLYTERVAFYREGDEGAGPVLVGVPAEAAVWRRAWELAPDGGYLHIRRADADPGAAADTGGRSAFTE